MSHRAFCESLLGDEVAIDESEAHHLLHVLRLKPGDTLSLFDGRGTEVDAVIDRNSRREVFCTITSRRAAGMPKRSGLTVIAAPPKAERLKWMVEKLTEIGVDRLILLDSERTVVTPAESRVDKLRSTVISACKQCRRNELMVLSPLQKFATVLEDIVSQRLPGRHFIAHPNQPNASHTVLENGTVDQSRLLLIGPEGGFTDAELQAAIESGGKTLQWPSTILRVETAAVVFATQLLVG
jgi:16S rRNA (uracil1498-N3)-methyltransferase